jgi:signal transduction histidine kinase
VEDRPEVEVCALRGEPLPPEQRPTRRALAGETIQSADVRVIWASGQERDFTVTAAPLHAPGNREARVVTVFREVTTQRQQERAAQQYAETEARRRLLQSLLETLPNGVFLVEGEESRLVLANQAAEVAWGASWPVGMSARDFLRTSGVRLFQADGRPLPSAEVPEIRVLHQSESIRAQQLVIRQPNGTTLPVLVSAVTLPVTPLAAQRGATREATSVLAVVVMQEIGALKEAERLKDEFVALVSHELKNPLTSIKGYVQLFGVQFAANHPEPLSEQERLCLQVVEEEVDRLAGLASDVVDVARVQSGRLVLRLDDVDLVGLVRLVAERQQITTTTHALRVQTEAEALWILADRSRLEQVLFNLVGNAIKYSPAGGVVEMRLTQPTESSQVQVSVQDHDIGIPQAQQARLFARFMRASNAAACGISGTGLGLFLCRELIERHGGRIWLESEEGQGSTISFVLPLAGPAERLT